MILNSFNKSIKKTPLVLIENMSWVMELDSSGMDFPWTHSQWQDSRSENLYLHYYEDRSGFCLFNISDVLHLYKIVVNPNFRRLGRATSLIQSLRDDACGKDIYLEVSDRNQEAIGFYKSLGFDELYRQARFYSDGTGCIKMTLRPL